jgi:gephyrin
MEGLGLADSLGPRMLVRMTTAVTGDAERPEFHRVVCSPGTGTDVIQATSTGGQRSSRLQSMADSNAVVLVPAGAGTLPAGTYLTAYLSAPLKPAALQCEAASSLLREDSTLSLTESITKAGAFYKPFSSSSNNNNNNNNKQQRESSALEGKPYKIRTALLTISDRASSGVYEDKSGPAMQQQLELMTTDPAWPSNLSFSCVASAIVADDIDSIRRFVCEWSDSGRGADVILTSGGTGFGGRDQTPEAIRPLLHKEAPGIANALLSEGLKHTALAVLSRPVAGTRNNTFICTLPGSVKAVRENLIALRPLLPRIVELLVTEPAVRVVVSDSCS